MAGDPDDERSNNGGGVVDPDELDIEDDDHVKPLGDNRYVVSADEPIGQDDSPGSVNEESEPEEQPSGIGNRSGSSDSGDTDSLAGDSVDVHQARAKLTERMLELRGAYGFDIIAQFGEEVVQQHRQANDIVSVFDALLLWYAAHLDDETPAEQAIGLLLAESDIPVEYPADVLIELIQAHGLDSDDTIADLIEAACDQTVQFPPK